MPPSAIVNDVMISYRVPETGASGDPKHPHADNAAHLIAGCLRARHGYSVFVDVNTLSVSLGQGRIPLLISVYWS